jgi:hypothetical protein
VKTDADFDLAVIRGLGAEPADESLTRTWYRMTKREKRRPRSRVLAPVAVAAAVLALVGGTLVVYRAGAGVYWPVASTPDTISTLNALADTASLGTPLTIGPDQVILTEMDSVAGACSPTECVIEAQTTTKRWYDVHAGQMINLPIEAQAKAERRSGIHAPTLQWLASLPTDPKKLLAHLRVEVGQHQRWTVDGQLWDRMSELYAQCELALTPAQRAALLRAFTGMTGLSTRHIALDGRSLVAIRQTDDTNGHEILFDPDTGRAVGRASYYLGSDVTFVNPFEPGGLSRSIWTQSVVPAQ